MANLDKIQRTKWFEPICGLKKNMKFHKINVKTKKSSQTSEQKNLYVLLKYKAIPH